MGSYSVGASITQRWRNQGFLTSVHTSVVTVQPIKSLSQLCPSLKVLANLFLRCGSRAVTMAESQADVDTIISLFKVL